MTSQGVSEATSLRRTPVPFRNGVAATERRGLRRRNRLAIHRLWCLPAGRLPNISLGRGKSGSLRNRSLLHRSRRDAAVILVATLTGKEPPNDAGNKNHRDDEQEERVETIERNGKIHRHQYGRYVCPRLGEYKPGQEGQANAQYEEDNVRAPGRNSPKNQRQERLKTQSSTGE